MHCKVYFAPSIGGVVGSANRSKAALDDNDTAGQDEAAIYISEKPTLRDIQSWFQDMWADKNSTRTIKRADISSAKAAFDKAQAARQKSGIGLKPGKQRRAIIPPLTKKLPSDIRTYAKADFPDSTTARRGSGAFCQKRLMRVTPGPRTGTD
jgi:phosphatidylserine/phosphatidylglycerophosphate/cardiolipin synthase-like enzyme